MPNYRRAKTGNCFFFTVVSWHRRPIFTLPAVRQALRHAIGRVRRDAPFQIDAFVLLPDHLHCIWTLPESDTAFPMRWRLIKTLVTQQCDSNAISRLSGSGHKRQGTIWQKRYWEHAIRDEQDFARHVDYIHFNPLKHGLVGMAKDWPYSSFHRFVSMELLPLDWGGVVVEGTFGE